MLDKNSSFLFLFSMNFSYVYDCKIKNVEHVWIVYLNKETADRLQSKYQMSFDRKL